MQVQVNVGGTVNNPGSIVFLAGYLTFNSTDPDSPHILPIEAWITDTLIQPFWDTIRTSCTRLVVGSSGNFGRQGLDKYTLDYVVLGGDCDSSAVDYIYDGSPVIGFCTNGGADTMVNFSAFSVGYVDTSGFVPIGDHTPTTDMGEYEVFETGVIVTHDSLIAIEKIWYAPKTHPDTCSFVIECIKIYLYDTLKPPPTSIYIGEAIDVDVPADTGARNHSGFDYDHSLIYQQGSEEDGEGCQPNDNRWGGMDFLMAYKNGVPYDSTPHGARTLDNATQIYPYDGYAEDSLYKYMSYSGFAVSDSDNVDLNMIMTFDTLATLLPGDTYVFYIEVVTHMNGTLQDFLDEVERSKRFFNDYIRPVSSSCCKVRGDVDGTGSIDVGDLTYLVAYLFQGGTEPPCDIEGDVDGTGSIDVGDLTFLVAYLFQGGADPPPCT